MAHSRAPSLDRRRALGAPVTEDQRTCLSSNSYPVKRPAGRTGLSNIASNSSSIGRPSRQHQMGHYRSSSVDKNPRQSLTYIGSDLPSKYSDKFALISPVSYSNDPSRSKRNGLTQPTPFQSSGNEPDICSVLNCYYDKLVDLKNQAKLIRSQIIQWETGLKAWELWLESKLEENENSYPLLNYNQSQLPMPPTSDFHAEIKPNAMERNGSRQRLSSMGGGRFRAGQSSSAFANDDTQMSSAIFQTNNDISDHEWMDGELQQHFSYTQPDAMNTRGVLEFEEPTPIRPRIATDNVEKLKMRQFHLAQARKILQLEPLSTDICVDKAKKKTDRSCNSSGPGDADDLLNAAPAGNPMNAHGDYPYEHNNPPNDSVFRDDTDRSSLASKRKIGAVSDRVKTESHQEMIKHEEHNIPSTNISLPPILPVGGVATNMESWDENDNGGQQHHRSKSDDEYHDKENNYVAPAANSNRVSTHKKPSNIPRLGLDQNKVPPSAWLSGCLTQGDTYGSAEKN